MKRASLGVLGIALCAVVIVSGCTARGGVAEPAGTTDTTEPGTVVAVVARPEPGDALREYLHGWMTHYNSKVGAADPASADATWTPETPDYMVSVVPSVSMSDFETVSVWTATIHAFGPVSASQASYRADFTFWRGSPLSSVRPATPLSASATYDLSWDEGRSAWTITQTSDSPDRHLKENPEPAETRL